MYQEQRLEKILELLEERKQLSAKEMVDYFIDNGFNYFDTAHGYLDGKSYN